MRSLGDLYNASGQFRDIDGFLRNYKVADGKPRISSNPYTYDIAEGYVANHSRFDMSGENIDVGITTETIVDYGGAYTYLTSAAAMYISSSNAGDNQEYVVWGLDGNYDEISATAAANGQNQVRVGTTETFFRIFGVYNNGTTNNAGDIYVAESDNLTAGVPDTPSKIKAMARAGNNNSFSGIYTVPRNKCVYLIDGYASNSAVKSVTFTIKYRPVGKVFRTTRPVQLYQQTLVFSSAVPAAIPERTDIEFAAKANSVGGGILSAGLIGWIEIC